MRDSSFTALLRANLAEIQTFVKEKTTTGGIDGKTEYHILGLIRAGGIFKDVFFKDTIPFGKGVVSVALVGLSR
jgi:hypothetical protein